MPIYQYKCFDDGTFKEELRKINDDSPPPQCPICLKVMTKILSPPTVIFQGSGWTYGSQEKLKRRSEEQGKKFFKRHPDKQELVSKYVYKGGST